MLKSFRVLILGKALLSSIQGSEASFILLSPKDMCSTLSHLQVAMLCSCLLRVFWIINIFSCKTVQLPKEDLLEGNGSVL